MEWQSSSSNCVQALLLRSTFGSIAKTQNHILSVKEAESEASKIMYQQSSLNREQKYAKYCNVKVSNAMLFGLIRTLLAP
eukprot:82431-Amphidinium_carterae.1